MISSLDTQFDTDFKTIRHYSNYPEMLPFVGKNWNNSKKILLLGESHHLPYEKLKGTYDYFNNWYDGNSSDLDKDYVKNIITRNNIAEIESDRHWKSLLIYSNLYNVLKEIPGIMATNTVFGNFSYYNYFQRPAGSNGASRSINASQGDKEFAYKTLLEVSRILKPRTIIFTSTKSYKAFQEFRSSDSPELFTNGITIDFVPHAGRQWWHMESRAYNGRTGKKKFQDLIETCYKD